MNFSTVIFPLLSILKSLKAVQSFYVDSRACVKAGNDGVVLEVNVRVVGKGL